MDLNKLLKRKQKAENDNNQQALAETCNKLGNWYMNASKYQKALGEFCQESVIYQSLDKKMDYGRANRMIGEVYVLMGKYKDALKHEHIYLDIARKEDDLVEMQRAYATIGRCYLLQAEDDSIAGSIDAPSDLRASEKAFLKSLMICKELGKLVSKWELADMQARLYLNLGVTKEHADHVDDAINYYETAINICKSNDLFELHHQCLMASGFSYQTKKDDTAMALTLFNSALEVAKRIHDKNEKMCETLLAKSNLLIKNGDYQSAKQILKKAYKLKTPNSSEKEIIDKNLKILLTLCKREDELVITDSFDYPKRKELFEKLGDGSCKIKNYSKAIDFYLKALEAAQLNGEDGNKLIPLYVSLYQTYIDNKDYESALEFMKKEYELIKSEPKEACATLLALGNLMDLAGKDFWEVDSMYRKALEEARAANDQALEKTVMVKLVKFTRKRSMICIAEMLEQEATGKGINLNESSEDTEYSEDIPDIGDDVSLELLLSSDPESSDNDIQKSVTTSSRKKRPSMTVKKNAKGETRLHEACINGNYQIAKMLIDQGHAINVRDNAGWLPLHEASIHGFRDVVELLLDNGAHSAINDKGGTSCDGITPLYDAASNGNLSVVQLLLDRGAKATVKTDFNETPYEALLRWNNEFGHKLSATEKEFYETIKQRLMEQCEKVGIDTSVKIPNTLSSGYQSARSRNSQSDEQRINRRYNASVSDDSDENQEDGKIQEDSVRRNARLEYRSVMNRLKKPHNNQEVIFDEPIEVKKRSAHLNLQEVDPDEWLDDDLGPMRKKQKVFAGIISDNRSPVKTQLTSKSFSRKPSSSLIDSDSDVESLKRSPEENQITVKSLSRTPSSVLIDSDSDLENVPADAFDVVMNASKHSKHKARRRSSTNKPQRRQSVQPSLLDAGFVQFVEASSPTEISPPRLSSSNTTLNTTVAETQLIIKVQIEDERIIVPVIKETAPELKISWLVEEAARRYYCIKGIRPELKLKTADGATLLESDPVSLILSLADENLIQSEILDWKLPSLSKRYIEACSERKCAVDQDINELLENNRAAVHLDLSNQNLLPSFVQPIFKAIQHQSCLLELDVSSNFIQDEGIKYLSQTLITLKQLHLLNVSGNMVTENGVEHLCNVLARSQTPIEIKRLELSFNPIQSSSLKFVSTMCRCKNIISLSLTSCELTEVNRLEQLTTVKCLDISYNHLTSEGFKGFLNKLNPSIIETLNLERCSSVPSLGNTIVQFVSSGCYASLREINFSGLNFTENEILDILRSVEKCQQLKAIDLSHQKNLTFMTLKYILFNMESQCIEEVKLIGCKSLQNPSHMFNYQNIDEQRVNLLRSVELSVPKVSELSTREGFVEKMRDLWDAVSGYRGQVVQDKNILRLIL